jgi:hypothetical protein
MLAHLQSMDTTMAGVTPRRDVAWAGTAPSGSATLILIASAGHSGSTLLDLLIGNHPLVASAGEMNRLTLHAPDRVCACGATVTNCSYWKQVRTAVTKIRKRTSLIPWEECHTDIPPQRPMLSLDMTEPLELANGAPPAVLRHRLTQAGMTVSEDAMLSRAGGRDFKWRMVDPGTERTWVLRPVEGRLDVYDETVTWKNPVRVLPQPLEVALALGVQPALTVARACSSAASDFVHIGENSWTVADAMAAVSGTPFVIDSSKSPLRLKLLYMLRRDRVRIVHLVRDGRAVAASAMRRRDMSAALAGRLWKRDNQNLAVMLASVPARLRTRVHYEALCEDPVREMTRIGNFLGLEFDPTMLTLGQRPVHNIPGNPMLFHTDRRTITKDERWRRDLSDRDLAAFERAAGRLNRSFGYR